MLADPPNGDPFIHEVLAGTLNIDAPIDVKVSKDGEAPDPSRIAGTLEIEANASLDLTIGDVADVEIRGGDLLRIGRMHHGVGEELHLGGVIAVTDHILAVGGHVGGADDLFQFLDDA